MTPEAARGLAEQVLMKYPNNATLAMRDDVARLVLHVEQETLKATSKTDPPRPTLIKESTSE